MVAQSLLLNLTMAKNTVLHRFSKHYITPTLLQYSPTPYFQCVFLSFQAFLRAFFYAVFYLSSLVLQKVLQLLQRNDTTRL